MVTKFEQAMMKLAVVGHDPSTLTDCSEVIPTPASVTLPSPTLPAGKSLADVQAACSATPFPALSAAPGERPLYCTRAVVFEWVLTVTPIYLFLDGGYRPGYLRRPCVSL